METPTPVVLVHGLSGSARWWRETEAALAGTHDVHVVDLPGHGTRRRTPFALADAPDFVADRLAEVGRAHLVGHSLGGVLCARVAAEHPELVDKLVLVAPAGSLPRRSFSGHALPLAAAMRAAGPTFLRVLVEDALRVGPFTLWQAARELLRDDVLPDLRAIAAPTLLVWGERDPLVPPSVGELFRTGIPDSRLELVRGARHVPMVERPHEFASLVREFLGTAAPEPGDV